MLGLTLTKDLWVHSALQAVILLGIQREVFLMLRFDSSLSKIGFVNIFLQKQSSMAGVTTKKIPAGKQYLGTGESCFPLLTQIWREDEEQEKKGKKKKHLLHFHLHIWACKIISISCSFPALTCSLFPGSYMLKSYNTQLLWGWENDM